MQGGSALTIPSRRDGQLRVTQVALAQALGISQGAVSRYERGKADLPGDLTPDDYAAAVARLLSELRGGQAA